MKFALDSFGIDGLELFDGEAFFELLDVLLNVFGIEKHLCGGGGLHQLLRIMNKPQIFLEPTPM